MEQLLITGLDTETTGLKFADEKNPDKIIEIAMLVYEWPSRRQVLKFIKRIQPNRSIAAKAYDVHGIDLADLAGCPTFDKVAPSIATIMRRSDLLVAHNGYGFDFPFIVTEMLAAGVEPPEAKFYDTMVEGRWSTFDGKVPNLGELCQATKVPYDPSEAHAADYDTDCMMQALFNGVDLGFFNLEGIFKSEAA